MSNDSNGLRNHPDALFTRPDPPSPGAGRSLCEGGNQDLARIFSALETAAGASLPSTRLVVSSTPLMAARAASAAASASFSPPYCLSEKYRVKVVPAREMLSR